MSDRMSLSSRTPNKSSDSRSRFECLQEGSLDSLILNARKVNEGMNGVISIISLWNLPEGMIHEQKHLQNLIEGSQAVTKMMKIFVPGEGMREFENQQKAHEIVMRAQANDPEKKFAQVPRAFFCQDVVPQTNAAKVHLENAHVRHTDEVEVVIMDLIEGEDLATFLFREVARRHTGLVHLRDEVDEMPIDQLMIEVSGVLGFVRPGGKHADNSLRTFEESVVQNENAEKLLKFLHRDGFVLNEEWLEKIENTVRAWHREGFHHRDLHERNVMIDRDGEIFVIDFGTAQVGEGGMIESHRFADDLSLVARWRDLTKSFDHHREQKVIKLGQQLDQFETLVKRHPKWQEVEKMICEGKMQEVAQVRQVIFVTGAQLAGGSVERMWDLGLVILRDLVRAGQYDLVRDFLQDDLSGLASEKKQSFLKLIES